MQNVAARIVSCCDKRSHITPVLHSLHWLPIEQRIKYKILLMTFKCIHDLAPKYLCELIYQRTPNRSRRSQYQNSLILPRTRLKSCGDRTFSFAAPTEWNKLPPHLKISPNIDSFKKNLKAFLLINILVLVSDYLLSVTCEHPPPFIICMLDNCILFIFSYSILLILVLSCS